MTTPRPVFRRVRNEIERDTCMAIRRQVFIIGQDVPEDLEVDGMDNNAIHYIGLLGPSPAATARVRIVEKDGLGKAAKIERVAVLEEHRGKGLGKGLMEYILADICTIPGITSAILGAQEHAIGFYENLGFSRLNTPYMDAGIPHDDMVLILSSSPLHQPHKNGQ